MSRIAFPILPRSRRCAPFNTLRDIAIVSAQGEKMKRAIVTVAVGFTIGLFQTIVHAEVDAAWAKAKLRENACLTCHYVNGKKFGPSFQAVSKKYRGKTPDDILVRWHAFRVHTGVRTQISDEDLKLCLEWILTLRPGAAPRDR
jgi:cytochrome c551/c552